MQSHELLKLFQEQVFDLESPPLWSKPLVYSYIDDAQKWFCRLTDGISDSSSDAAVLELNAGDPWATLHPSVQRIRAARRSDGRPIDLVPIERIGDEGIRLTTDRGTPKAIITGMEEGRVRIYMVPEVSEQIQLDVFRLPLADITGPNQDLEIRSEHQQALLHWVCHRAYGRQDAETYDKKRSGDFEIQFRQYCLDVKQEQARLRRTPMPIMYGGL